GQRCKQLGCAMLRKEQSMLPLTHADLATDSAAAYDDLQAAHAAELQLAAVLDQMDTMKRDAAAVISRLDAQPPLTLGEASELRATMHATLVQQHALVAEARRLGHEAAARLARCAARLNAVEANAEQLTASDAMV